jgi:hypothetical protein
MAEDMVAHADQGVGEREQEIKVSVPTWVSGMGGNALVVTLAVGLASALLIAIRLMSVAQFNIETTYGLLQAAGTGIIIVATVISLIPGIAITVAFSSAVLVIFFELESRTYFSCWAMIVLFTLVAVFTTPLIYWPAILFGAFVLVLARAFRGFVLGFKYQKLVAVLSAVFVAVLLMAGIVQSPPWSPEEDFAFKGSPKVTGYILSQTDYVTTILLAKPRAIAYYDTRGLESQHACRSASPWYDLSVIAFMPGFNPAHYRPC